MSLPNGCWATGRTLRIRRTDSMKNHIVIEIARRVCASERVKVGRTFLREIGNPSRSATRVQIAHQ